MRVYACTVSAVAVTAAQDILSFTSTANMAIRLLAFGFGQLTQTSMELLRYRVRILPATVTAGSGGAAVTPAPALTGDTASVFTSRRNDTTQATSSGTVRDMISDNWNLLNGVYMPLLPEIPIIAKPSEAIIISLDSAPAASRTINAWAHVVELF